MLLLLFACATPQGDDTAAATYFAPDAPGPFLAGTAELAFTGPAGEGQPVQVWFPASDADDDAYRYDDFLEGSAGEHGEPDCSASRPVLVFSHGSGGVRYQSIFLTEHLATHGWVVVAPDHVGNTFFDDGAVPRGEMALRRPLDAVAAFDWLAQTNADGLLDGCVDPADGFAIAGHSFGAFTTLAVAGAIFDAEASAAYCQGSDEWLCDDFAEAMAAAGETVLDRGDDRVWAAVSMAPAGYEVLLGGLAEITAPTLVLGGSLDWMTPMETQVEPIYRDLVATPRALGTVDGAGHFSFSDACAMVPTYEDCSPPYLPNADTHPVISTVTTAFLHHARGDADAAAWLPDPDATILQWEAE